MLTDRVLPAAAKSSSKRLHRSHVGGLFLSGILGVLLAITGSYPLGLGAGGAEVLGGVPDQRARLRSAFSLFAEADLQLPSLHVELVGEPTACNASGGSFRRSWPLHHIRLCTASLKVMVHELAHAWVYLNLDGEERARFQKLRGADTWSSHAYPWRERATEHAAEIMTWALLELPSWHVRVAPNDATSLTVAYHILLEAAPDLPRRSLRSTG